MLKLKLQYFGHLVKRTDSLEKTLMLETIEGRRRRGWQKMRWLDGITDSMDVSLSKLWEWWWAWKPGVLQSMGSQRVRHDWATELNWTSALFALVSFLFWNQWHWKGACSGGSQGWGLQRVASGPGLHLAPVGSPGTHTLQPQSLLHCAASPAVWGFVLSFWFQ